MTATTSETRASEGYVKKTPGRVSRFFENWAVKLVIVIIVIIWIVPTLGVLISSFRPSALVNLNGWWTVFTNF